MAAVWSAAYYRDRGLVFGVGVLVFGGATMGTEYFAGYVTEKALSVDNLFVFLIIMASFRVPRADQQKVLLFGIVFSLIARTGFIFLGAALINTFAWVFYLFGLILLLTAGNLLKPEGGDDAHTADNFIVRIAKKVFHTTEHYDGDKLFTMEDGKRVMTPMLLVMVAIGGTDILFALDSIPAIFGLTQNVFIVFTATAFSLLGLRQLLLPHRRPARPAHLPLLRSGGDPRVHRREADFACTAREQRPVHQRRRARRTSSRSVPAYPCR